MAEEIERAYEIGHDAFGRRVTLTRRRHYTGKPLWKIVSHPSSQRDDGEVIDSLSIENLREIANVTKDEKL